MKLNPDCIRDILLVIEKETDGIYGIELDFSESGEIQSSVLSKYSKSELRYHVQQCEYSGYFVKVSWFLSGKCVIYDLSPDGHQFIANIRSENIWNTVKKKAAQIGSFSLNTLTQIASAVITEIINRQIPH